MPTNLWHLVVLSSAQKKLDALPTSKVQKAVIAHIDELVRAVNPKQIPGVKKLRGKEFRGKWRQRYGNYRIIFSVVSAEIVVDGITYKGTLTVEDVDHRSKVYDLMFSE